MNFTRRIVLIFLISVVGVQAFSQSYYLPEKNQGRRHQGFYLSLAGGVYSSNVDIEDDYSYTKVKGIGSAMDIKIGAAIKEDLIVHLTLLNHALYEPKIYNSNNSMVGVDANNKELSEIMIGGGVTYYTPRNFLLSSSIGYGGYTLLDEANNIDISSESGFCFQLKAGKEWWVSRKLALGLAAYYHKTIVHNNPNEYVDERLNSNNFGVVLSLTFNGRN
jgi:hypothetical protein